MMLIKYQRDHAIMFCLLIKLHYPSLDDISLEMPQPIDIRHSVISDEMPQPIDMRHCYI